MEYAIKNLKAFQRTRTFMCHCLNLTVLVKYKKCLKLLIFESIHQHMALLVAPQQTRDLEIYISFKTFNNT